MVEKKKDNKKLISRRDFLVVGGAAVVAGALSACTPKTETITSTLPGTTKTVTNTTTQTAPMVTATVIGEPVTTTKTATTTATVTGAPVTTTATTTAMVDKIFDVVSPIGDPSVDMIKMAPRLDTLNGKTVCFVRNDGFRYEQTFPVIEKLLKAKYPSIKIISYDDMPVSVAATATNDSKGEVQMAAALKKYKADAVISGNGG